MTARAALVVLLLVSTAAFVVGVIIERSDEDGHAEAAVAVAPHEAGEPGELAEEHADERAQAEPRHSEGGSAHAESGERDTLAVVAALHVTAAAVANVVRRAAAGPS